MSTQSQTRAGIRLMDTALPTLRMHEAYASELIGDLCEEDLDMVPGVGHENTPRFTIGHLCTGSALTRWVIERPEEDKVGRLDIPEIYQELFQRRGPADRRFPCAASDAPSGAELLEQLAYQHDLLDQSVRAAHDELLARPCAWKLGHLLKRHGDLIMFVCSHEALHLGQVASWRRAMGLGAAMSRMIENR